MTNEIITLLDTALKDPTHGVVAQLATLVAADNVPDADDALIPAAVTVINGMNDDDLARGDLVKQGKNVMVMITPDGPLVTEAANIKGEYALGTLPVSFTIVIRSGENAAKKARKGLYVARAVRLTLQWFFAQRQDARTLRRVTLLRTTTIAEGLIVDDGAAGAIGAVVTTVQALDALGQRTY